MFYCDIIVLSECFQFSCNQFNIPGYNIHYNNADLNKNDGMLIYTKQIINVHIIDYKLSRSLVTLSKITVTIQNITFGINCVYRPPSTNERHFIEDIEIYLADNLKNQIEIFVGDINLNICDNNNEHVNLYLSTLNEYGFSPFITCPTRVTSTTASCIDHIFVRRKLKTERIWYQSFVLNSDLTDHYPIMLNVLSKPVNQTINKLEKTKEIKIEKVNYDKLINLLQIQDWQSVINTSDSIVATDAFYRIFMHCYEQAKNIRIIKISEHKKKKPWITNGIINSIKHRDKMKKRLLQYHNDELKNQYKLYRNFLNKLITRCKNEFYQNEIKNNEGDIKKIYKIISEATNEQRINNNENINILLDDVKFETDKDMANHCNNFFINIGKHMADRIKPVSEVYLNHISNSSMFLYPVNHNELINHIHSLKNNSAPGIDGVPSKIIKDMHVYIIKPLLHIINLIFKTGTVPIQFKTTIVSPIHKAGSKHDINNFRPISVMNNFGKIFEKCLKHRLIKFFNENNILSKNQFGFVGGHSTCDAMCELVGQITTHLNAGEKSIAVFLDLAKAFDTVPHDKLLSILDNYGVRGVVLNVFKSYLTDRKQMVKIRNSYSDAINIEIGVPQGTVLGPILFITYINSLTNLAINGTIVSYADDTALLFSGKSWDEVKERVKLGLTRIKNWLDYHKLTLNLNKTNYIAFSITSANRPSFSSISIEKFDNSIKEVSNTKYLGITIDKHLKWEDHAFRLKNNVRKLIHKFYLLRGMMSKNLLIMVYRTLVESLIRYGIVVWGGLYNNALKQLNVIQNFILKVIYNKGKHYPTALLYNEDIFNVRSLYILAICLYVHKEKKIKNYVNHQYETRNKTQKNLQIPMSYKDINQRFLTYLGPKFYNLLPVSIRQIKNYKKFNKKCRAYIVERYIDFINSL